MLNFILPDIFGDLSTFQEWYEFSYNWERKLTNSTRFNIPTMQESLTSEQAAGIVTSLHNILKPFLLRRLKVDVEYNLPPKKEYVLYAPLTERQKAVYEAVLKGSLRNFLIDSKRQRQGDEIEAQEKNDEELKRLLTEPRKLRVRGKKRNYDVDGSDEEFFRKIESGEIEPPARFATIKESAALLSGKEHLRRTAGKFVKKKTV